MLLYPAFSPRFGVALSLHGLLLRYVLVHLLLALLFPGGALAQVPDRTRNITIPIVSPQIIYTPFLCNRTTTQNTTDQCTGGWVTRRTNDQVTISTTGPEEATGEVIPQFFFQFRGSALYLLTSENSTAQANITVTTNGTTLSAVFDSNLGSASILNLVASTVTTFALTFLPNNGTQQFELTSMIATVPDGILTTTLPFLPSMTLPPSSSPPIFSPRSTSSSSSRSSSISPSPPPSPSPIIIPTSSLSSIRRSNIAIAVGVTLGLGLGLTSVTAAGYWWYKKRKSRRMRLDSHPPADQNDSPVGQRITGARGGGDSSWFDSRATRNDRFASSPGGFKSGVDGLTRPAAMGWKSS